MRYYSWLEVKFYMLRGFFIRKFPKNHQPKSYYTCYTLLYFSTLKIYILQRWWGYLYIFIVSVILWSQVWVNHTFSGSLPTQILIWQMTDYWFRPWEELFSGNPVPYTRSTWLKFFLFFSNFLLFPTLLHNFDSVLLPFSVLLPKVIF